MAILTATQRTNLQNEFIDRLQGEIVANNVANTITDAVTYSRKLYNDYLSAQNESDLETVINEFESGFYDVLVTYVQNH